MAKKKPKRFLKAVKDYITPLSSSGSGSYYLGPTLEPYSSQRQQAAINQPRVASRHYRDAPIPNDEEVDRINRDRMEQAKLTQANEALDLTLRSQHKLLIATLITASVAMLVAIITSSIALVVAFHSKSPVVYERPNIIINR